MENKDLIIKLLEIFGVKEFVICNENGFCPKSISENSRTTHFIVQMENPSEYKLNLESKGFEEKIIQNLEDMQCFEKTFETEKIRIWIYHQNKDPNYCTDFVQHFIYSKYSQTII